MARARKGSVIQSKLGILIYGEAFTGKSTLASQLVYFKRPDGKPFRVLYLDSESGSIDDFISEMVNNGVDVENLYMVYTQSLGEVREYISKVKNNEDFYILDEDGNETDEIVLDADGEPFRADAIVVDGASVLNLTTKQGLIEFSKKRNKVKAEKEGLVGDARLVKVEGAGLELKDYNTINFKGQDLVLDLMACGTHYIITARETDEKQQVKLEDGTTTSVCTGRKIPEGFKSMDYNVKTKIRMFRDENGAVCGHVQKDRTHVHEDNIILEDPSLLDWQSVIDKTAGKKAFVIKNDLTKAVEIEQDIYKKEILTEAELAEIDSLNGSELTSNLTTNEADALRAEINAKKKALSPPDKAALKKKLEDAGLPIAYKNVTDAEILKAVLACF